MPSPRVDNLAKRLSLLDRKLEALRLRVGAAAGEAIDRWRSDHDALRFHMQEPGRRPTLLAVLGGTGTGKSTLVNRLLKAKVTGTSYRRTFTRGAVVIARSAKDVPPGWLGVPRVVLDEDQFPARGETGGCVIAQYKCPVTEKLSIIDSTDLDGDTPEHHAEADRIFRWAEALLFLVTPEKYQMTEMIPYYRLARRYGLPTLFAMNKVEEEIVLEDFVGQIHEREWEDAVVYAIPREDAPYAAPEGRTAEDLRRALLEMRPASAEERELGALRRCADLMSRLRDHVIEPLRRRRHAMDRLILALRTIVAPEPGLDVSPLTRQLHRRMQEQSILYLMGPQRMFERLRQAPRLLAWLPRTAWDLVARGEAPKLPPPSPGAQPGGELPDFRETLVDLFTVLQTRIDDVLRSNSEAEALLEAHPESWAATRIPAAQAGRIAEEEIGELRAWLEARWHKTPRDTAILNKLLNALPGGKRLAQYSEGAPYLLAIVLASHRAFFGPVDLIVLGGYNLATWVGEKISNEVSNQTRETNRKIGERYARLTRDQVDRAVAWLDQQAPAADALGPIEILAAEIGEQVQHDS